MNKTILLLCVVLAGCALLADAADAHKFGIKAVRK
jgi:hypothetical protein